MNVKQLGLIGLLLFSISTVLGMDKAENQKISPEQVCADLYLLLNDFEHEDDEGQRNKFYYEICDLIQNSFDLKWREYYFLKKAIKVGHDYLIRRYSESLTNEELSDIANQILKSKKFSSMQKLLFAIVCCLDETTHTLLNNEKFDQETLTCMLVAVAKYSQNVAILNKIIDMGADSNGIEASSIMYNPFYNALLYLNQTMAQALLEKNVPTTSAFRAILSRALRYNRLDLLNFAVAMGCHLNQQYRFEYDGEEYDFYLIEFASLVSSQELCLKILKLMPEVADLNYNGVLQSGCCRNLVSFIQEWLERFHRTQNLEFPFLDALDQKDEQMIVLLSQFQKIPVSLITYACQSNYLQKIPVLINLPMDISHANDAYKACIELYRHNFVNEFTKLLKVSFDRFRDFDKRDIASMILTDTFMSVKDRNDLLAYCIPLVGYTDEDIQWILYNQRQKQGAPKPLARNLLDDFNELADTEIPYVASLLGHKDYNRYNLNQITYITKAFSEEVKQDIIYALQLSALQLDIEKFEFIISKISIKNAEWLNDQSIQLDVLRAILYAPAESEESFKNKTKLIRKAIFDLNFTIDVPYVSEASYYDLSFSKELLIFKIMLAQYNTHFDFISFKYDNPNAEPSNSKASSSRDCS